MSGTYTTYLRLLKPATGDLLWGTSYNFNFDAIDKVLGGLAVCTWETPSTSLKIAINPGPRRLKNAVSWYTGGGGVSMTLPPNSTKAVYIIGDSIAVGAAFVDGPDLPFPKGTLTQPITPLAVVVAGASTITSIVDYRFLPMAYPLPMAGPYSNDTEAGVVGSVAVGEQYYDATGIVHVRLT